MKLIATITLMALSSLIPAKAQSLKAPVAKKIKQELKKHGETRIDNYYWLNQRENPEVIEYLKAENDYTSAVMKDQEALQEKLFNEIKSRIKEDDASVPFMLNGYWYEERYKTGSEYPVYIRRKGSLDAKEEIMFDVNEMAKSHKFYRFDDFTVSDDNKLAAYSVDTVSRRIYTIRIKNLETGEILRDKLENTSGSPVWATDNKTIFYIVQDAETLRDFQIWKHTLGTDQSQDTMVYQENDDTFEVFVFRSKSRKYIFIGSSSTMADEYRFIPAGQTDAKWKIIQPRQRGLEYSVEHFGDDFYILTNKDKAENFKLMKTPVDKTGKKYWTDVVPHNPQVLIEDFDVFNNFLVLQERYNGLTQIDIRSWDGKTNYLLPFKEETYSAYMGENPEINADILRYSYTSMTTPDSVIDFNMSDKTQEVKKERAVLGDFNKENYETKRIWVSARDGVKVPVSIVYKKGLKIGPDTPMLQYGYGSYGVNMDAYFSVSRLSLLDRGFIYAIAHIRGGQEMGRYWYEDGKLLKKKNTFNDFIDISRYFIENNYTSPEHLYAMGGSAGGLLMGAVMNQAPELYKGIIAQVPFVDVVTTMLDDSIPLTTGEYDEWGNPNEKKYYAYMKSYSPYDNVESKAYPNLLVTTGLHDSQVQYWEPAKWVAKLRELKTDQNLLLLQTNMEAGHGGASGRFEALKESVFEFAFIFKLEGIEN